MRRVDVPVTDGRGSGAMVKDCGGSNKSWRVVCETGKMMRCVLVCVHCLFS